MDSTAQTAPAASEIFNETASTHDPWIRQRKQLLRPQTSSSKLLPLVTHGFDSSNSPCGFRIHQRNCFHSCPMDSTAQTALVASENINETSSTRDPWIRQRKQHLRPQKSSTKLLPLVTHGFDSVNSPCVIRNLHRNCFHL